MRTLELKEIWKDITGYEGLYQVSNFGNVISFKREGSKGGLLKPILSNQYYSVNLWKNGTVKMVRLHRLVCNEFKDNADCKTQINHIDGNKLNNSESNLEFVSPSENMKHAYSIGLAKPPMKGRFGCLNVKSKTIHQYDKNLNLIKSYESMGVAERETKCRVSGISLCANGKLETSGGYIWKF
jgi:hypothetical protein